MKHVFSCFANFEIILEEIGIIFLLDIFVLFSSTNT